MPTILERAAQAEMKLTGKRYCSQHQGMVALDAGSIVVRGRSRRWMCFQCQRNSALRPNAKASTT
jgi:hypothetical protein